MPDKSDRYVRQPVCRHGLAICPTAPLLRGLSVGDVFNTNINFQKAVGQLNTKEGIEMNAAVECPCCQDEIRSVVPKDGRWRCYICGGRGIVGSDNKLIRQKKCPCCGVSAVDTTRTDYMFWRCSQCRQAIKQDTRGRLVPWLDVNARPKRKPFRCGRKS